MKTAKVGNFEVGGEKFTLIGGPCVAESPEICFEIASFLKDLCMSRGVSYIFKASFDKANRSSGTSFRGRGMEYGLEILSEIKSKLRLPVLTDIHESEQAPAVAKVVDVLQIPAFLCRQTDLLVAAARTGLPVTAKIRLGQGEDSLNFREVIAELESAGVDAITVHARTRKQRYAGMPRYDLMRDLRSEMSVPLIVSGNIFSLDDAIGYTGITGADAVMVARGGVGNPYLVTQIDRWFRDGSRLPNPTMSQQVDWCMELADLMYAEKGDEVASKKMRSIAPKFVVGCRKSREFRYRLATEIDTREDLDRILEEVRERLGDRVVRTLGYRTSVPEDD